MKKNIFLIIAIVALSTSSSFAYNFNYSIWPKTNNMTVGHTVLVPNEVTYSIFVSAESSTANQAYACIENNQMISISVSSNGGNGLSQIGSNSYYWSSKLGLSLPTSLMAITKAGGYTEAQASISYTY